jgi:hypothetical protein
VPWFYWHASLALLLLLTVLAAFITTSYLPTYSKVLCGPAIATSEKIVNPTGALGSAV